MGMSRKKYIWTDVPQTVERFMRLRPGVKSRLRPLHFSSGNVAGAGSERLAQFTQLLVLDESTQGLEVNGQVALYDFIDNIHRALGCDA